MGLFERWADARTTKEEILEAGFDALLEQVTNLHTMDESFQQDGYPMEVAQKIWQEIGGPSQEISHEAREED